MKQIAFTVLFCAALTAGVRAQPEIETSVLAYQIDGKDFEGYVARPKGVDGGLPAVLVVHDWTGHNAFARGKAEELARLGYVGFAVDMYGKDIKAKDQKEASGMAAVFYKDRPLFRKRINAAFEEIKKQPGVDAERIGAIGFCFGGTTALELARSGAPVKGVVCFHGGLSNPNPADAKNIKGRVLVLHGAIDPHVPPKDVAGLMEELNAANVWCKVVAYPEAVHAFTDPARGSDISKGAAYNENAAKQSWQEIKEFFGELFKQ